MEALGDIHVITGDKAVLDRLVLFSDAILSGRNDLVNGEKTVSVDQWSWANVNQQQTLCFAVFGKEDRCTP